MSICYNKIKCIIMGDNVMKKQRDRIYTIANAHLDTSWLWTYEKTIEEYIPDTFRRNFALLEKYPEYKFNFEGSLRYELLKEYYPDLYEELKKYISGGRWNPCGASYENGDVNIPSPEALIRNILYGNSFFRNEFGTESNDIFIPDCFGFGKALPTIAFHSGLKGFSTCKLPWGSSVGIPFDIGFWRGPDGNGVWSAIKPFSYTSIMKNIRENKRITDKLDDNKNKYGLGKTFVYHGNGDRGGAPKEASIREVVDCVKKNNNSDIEVFSATTKEFFEDISSMSDAEKNALPVWDSEFLMTRHGTGSYTSRTVTKRWNRRCELLADAAERFSVASMVCGLKEYPQYGLDSAWKKVIAHHFHDDITGTSFEECYKRSHSDYVQAMNTFSAEYTASCKVLAKLTDTSSFNGFPVVVSNPDESEFPRVEAVSIFIESSSDSFAVYDRTGNKVPAQTKNEDSKMKKITFLAEVPSCGIAVFDVVSADKTDKFETELKISENLIENKKLKVLINENGDISSIYDKRIQKEMLKEPIRMAILNNVHSFDWPAWEIKYEDIISKPYAYPANPEIRIKDAGPVLCSLEIIRKVNDTVFIQVISLDAESEYVSVYNETDWREEASLLKAQFSFAVENEKANYDIGIGYTGRGNNTSGLYEVPAQKWADITSDDDGFGVSVFSDSRTGWDKPDNSTLRLTCIHTPFANYRHECSQHIMDMGLNRYSFAVYPHNGKPDHASFYADRFCQPMHTFITDTHGGIFTDNISFVSVDNDMVRISALKKAQENENIIIRLVETSGEHQENVVAQFLYPVKSAYKVSGDEKILSEFPVTDGKLQFSADANSVNSFMLIFEKAEIAEKTVQQTINLEFNACGITDNTSRKESTLPNGISIPREMLPESLDFAGIRYTFCKEDKNCILCDGEEITVPEGFDTIHFLLTSLDGDRTVDFASEENRYTVTVQSFDEAPGMWDLMRSRQTGYIKPYPQALTVSHTHSPEKDIIGKQFYVYHAEIPLNGKASVKLPVDKNIVIFSATVEKGSNLFVKGDEHFDRLDKRKFDYTFSDYAKKHSQRKLFEKILDKFTDRTFCVHFTMEGCYNKNSLGDLYFILNNIADRLMYGKRKKKLLDSRKVK